jgi:ribosome-binding protein aMBF1 (putative translation factor)
MPHFGTLVSEARAAQKISVFELSLRARVQPQTIRNIENSGSCQFQNAIAVAAALGIESIPVS